MMRLYTPQAHESSLCACQNMSWLVWRYAHADHDWCPSCAGYLLFDQIRWRSQVQLQGMQVIAFLMVAAGSYLETGNWSSLLTQVLLLLPSIGACCQSSRVASPLARSIHHKGLVCLVSRV